MGNQSSCTECPAGYYCPSASASPVECPAGTYNPSLAQPDIASCIQCPAGYYCPNASSTINICSPGYYCPPGTEDAFNFTCLAGHYNSSYGATSCGECGLGYFINVTAATACLSCAAGTFANTTGQTECWRCEAGTYNSDMNASSCAACPSMEYLPYTGLTSCPELGSVFQSSFTGNSYGWLNHSSFSFSDAPLIAKALTWNNITGHLATVSCAAEWNFLCRTFGSLNKVWLAGKSDVDTWTWQSGAEIGQIFSNYNVCVPTSFCAWATDETFISDACLAANFTTKTWITDSCDTVNSFLIAFGNGTCGMHYSCLYYPLILSSIRYSAGLTNSWTFGRWQQCDHHRNKLRKWD